MQSTLAAEKPWSNFNDIGFAAGVVFILTVLLLPLPAVVVDLALACSISISVLVLMVALWIKTPLQFSSFPTILLLVTMFRLALNIATTRLILTDGAQGYDAAGHVVGGFATFIMGGDFVIGIIIFLILLTVNFIVITKGATRIAEVGARFTLDAIPGKQMAIDADLSAGLIDDAEAQRRRRELEEESAFFGSMDGASKFVRGDAIAGLIITTVNIFGGIIIGTTRHGMSIAEAVDVFTRLSVGDGLVSQVPALIVSLAAGLLVSKGGSRTSTERAVVGQLSAHPRALFMAAILMALFALVPALPFLPFAILSGILMFFAYSIPARWRQEQAIELRVKQEDEARAAETARMSVKEALSSTEVEICFGRQLSASLLRSQDELADRVAKLRRRFAQQYGFVIPDIKLTDDLSIAAKSYQIKVHGTVVATEELRVGEVLVILGDQELTKVPGTPARDPAFNLRAMWVPEGLAREVRNEGFVPVDAISVLLTHLSEVVRSNLAQLLSYKDMRKLLDRLPPEYSRLIEEVVPQHISYSGIQAVMKQLLVERVSIRNLQLVLEAIAEIAPHSRRTEQIAEHVRLRLSQQICGDLSEDGTLNLLRLGDRWDLAFHEALHRDAQGEVVQFNVSPALIEEFSKDANKALRPLVEQGKKFALVTTPDARPYVRLITERIFPNVPVLSNVEIARSMHVTTLGSIS